MSLNNADELRAYIKKFESDINDHNHWEKGIFKYNWKETFHHICDGNKNEIINPIKDDILLAIDENILTGMLFGTKVENYIIKSQQIVHNYHIVRLDVAILYQSKGIGTQLLQKAYQSSQNKGCRTMYLYIDHEENQGRLSNEERKKVRRLVNFYKRRGFKKHKYQLNNTDITSKWILGNHNKLMKYDRTHIR